MHRLFQKYIANGFADFSGLAISGKIPLRQELINETIAEVLRTAQASAPVASQPRAAEPAVTMESLLPLLKSVEIQAEPGVVTINFQVRA
jgi:hypothetical protein